MNKVLNEKLNDELKKLSAVSASTDAAPFVPLLRQIAANQQAGKWVAAETIDAIPKTVWASKEELQQALPGLSLNQIFAAASDYGIRGQQNGTNSSDARSWPLAKMLRIFLVDGYPLRRRNTASQVYVQEIKDIIRTAMSKGAGDVETGNVGGPPTQNGVLSPSKISALLDPNACRQCNWRKIRYPGSLLKMPGVFYDLDRYQKRVIRASLDETGKPPPWMPTQLADVSGYITGLDYRSFMRQDPSTGLLVRGEPDEIFTRPPGRGSVLVDHKTARLTDVQNELAPRYQMQLQLYAWISRAYSRIPTIEELALVYWEPQVKAEPGTLLQLNLERLALPLQPVFVPVDSDFDEPVRRCLDTAAELAGQDTPPPSMVNCGDCKLFKDVRDLGLIDE